MQFPTEEAKLVAASELPDTPPRGVNIDDWMAEIEKQRIEIESAEIVPESEEKPPDGQPPEGTQETPPPKTEEEDIVRFELKRDELPDELKGYKDGGEMVKQLGHARKYANTAEQRLGEFATENASLKEQLKEVETLKNQVADLQNASRLLEAQPKTAEVQANLDEVNRSLDLLDGLGDDDYLTAKQAKKVLGNAVEQINKAASSMNQVKQDFVTYKTENEAKYQTLETDFGTMKSENEETKRNTLLNDQKKAAFGGLSELQDLHPELKTEKPLVSETEDSVENDVRRFANKYLLVKTGNGNPSWDQRNAVINSFLRGDAETKAYCQQNGITPESVGTSEEEIGRYALISNIDAVMKGSIIDPYTGERKALINPITQQPVSLPSYEAAYNHIRNESGVAQKELFDKLAEAEKAAQRNVDDALSKKDLSSKTLGNKGEADPSNIGEEMTEEQATEVFTDPDIAEKIELNARAGNRHWFNLYNKAMKRLKYPEITPEEHWLPERA